MALAFHQAAKNWFLIFYFIFSIFPLFLTAQSIPGRTYIAEWEFLKKPWKTMNGSRPFLRHRMDGAYWSDEITSDWYLFGGNGFEKQYSDLWKFHGETLQWERIYPKTDPIVRAMVSPEKIPTPTLCGHHSPGKTILSVYGPKLKSDTVWIYEVNVTLWTAYVCTETQNSKHTFCPNFNQSKNPPIAWCDSSNAAMLAVIPSADVLQLWRFSLLTTRWEHVSMHKNIPINCNFTNDNSILYTSADGLLYFVCYLHNDTLHRYVYRYPTSNGGIESLGHINLTISPQKIVLTATRSKSGKIYLILGYQQLIDIWLLNEITLNWEPVDNVWKGNALKWIQAVTSNSGIFYLKIDGTYVLLSNPKEQKLEGVIQEQGVFSINVTRDDGSILRGEYGINKKLNVTEMPETTTSMSKIQQVLSTTTEWSAELVMEGSPENISTCCWNFTENVSIGSDRALLALSPQVNEVKSFSENKKSPFNTFVFFITSTMLFAFVAAGLLVKKFVKWQSRRSSSMLIEPPPIRYSVIPDELGYPSYPGA